MTNSQPLVSVLMTAYNREKYIAEAIESVLASTYTYFELIIVDDGSKDKTVEIAKLYEQKDSRVKVYVNEKNLGDYPNRNKAASYAMGKYIKYLDSDDIMYPYTLQIIVDYMEKFPEAGFGLAAVHDSKPYPIVVPPKQAYLEHFYSWGHFDRSPGSSIIRKDCFDDVGGFSEERFVGDTSLWFVLGRKYSLVKLPPHLYWNRQHNHQESKFEKEQAKKINKIRKQYVFNAIMHPECPLSKEERKEVIDHMKKGVLKNAIYRTIKRLIS